MKVAKEKTESEKHISDAAAKMIKQNEEATLEASIRLEEYKKKNIEMEH